MIALPITTAQEASLIKLRPVSRLPQKNLWLEDLDFFEKEVDFYCKMLRIGIRNGRAAHQPVFYELLNAFAQIRDSALPETRKTAAALMADEAKPEPAFFLQKELDELNMELRKLKSKAFTVLTDIHSIIIW